MHCPVKQETKSENLCFYHLPHVKRHIVFTTAVIDQILSLKTPSNIMRFKKFYAEYIKKNVFIPGPVKHKSMQKVRYLIWCVRSWKRTNGWCECTWGKTSHQKSSCYKKFILTLLKIFNYLSDILRWMIKNPNFISKKKLF